MSVYTKTGEPIIGRRFTFTLDDGATDTAKVVGKYWSRANKLIVIVVEWPDGVRQELGWPEIAERMADV